MSRRDLNGLRRAAVGLADRLQKLRIPSLRVAPAFAEEEHYNGGWSIHVATWSGRDVKIAVSLDQYSRARKRAFSNELKDLGLTGNITLQFLDAHKSYLKHHQVRFERECARRGRNRKSGG